MDKRLTNLTIDELAKILSKSYKPFDINSIPVFVHMGDNPLPGEIFKRHPEIPVEASNLGRIRFNGKILLQRPDEKKSVPYGYLWVEIPNVSKYQLVYRLVAETWCEISNLDYNMVHHISNNGTDNRSKNLVQVALEEYTRIKNQQKNRGVPDNMDYVAEGSTLIEWRNPETADIPAGINSIGTSAFCDCESLTAINIPAGVTAIGDTAFSGCKSLTTINIPAGVVSIGRGAFCDCENLVDISIPDGVTSIGKYAFCGCKSLASITIPHSVTAIGSITFFGCESLTAIDIPAGITSIGNVAFNGCKSLAAINIPVSVTSIGIRAFCNCESLAAINIPAGVTSIGGDAFLGCENLGSITVETENPRFTDVEGVLFDKIENRILCYPAGKKDTCYIVPASVTIIEGMVFYGCTSLVAIIIPASVISIGDLAFYDCENLSTITVEEKNLRFAGVGGVLFDKIGNRILCYPAGKKDISYTIPAGVTTIEDRTFSGCKNLAVITIPAGVTVIKGHAFSGCENLSTISVEEKNPRFTSIDGVLFDIIEKRILRYPTGKKETSYTIPAGITSIWHDAFDGCNTLKTVYISRVVSILNEKGSIEYSLGENQSVKFVYTD
jgi:hypothetical protein